MEAAEKLVERLSDVCTEYAHGKETETNLKKGFAHMFRHWVSYNSDRMEPEDEKYLADVRELIAELKSAFDELSHSDIESVRKLSGQAVEVVLFPHVSARREKQWFQVVVGYECEPLLDFLSAEDLKQVCELMIQRTPKRLMLPRELQLLKKAESLLKNK